jgi:O-antigen ligase
MNKGADSKNKPKQTATSGRTPVLQYASRHSTRRALLLPWITHIAFAISLIVVIARLTTPDALRDPWEVTPGGTQTPASPGPATGLVFDLIAALPALLILARRAIDPDFRLRLRRSHALLFALAGWAVVSTFWASDQFAAAVTSAHFFAAACLLWAMSQLVNTTGRFRLVTAVCFGLLLVLMAQSVMYKFVDVPENISYWTEHKEEILKARNWTPDSFSALQFEQKLTHGELLGFFSSPNTFAAVAVLLFAACVGIGIQKLVDRDSPKWGIYIAVGSLALGWILYCAQSKTAGATPVLGVGIILLFVLLHQECRDRHRVFFFYGVASVALGMLAVIGHGLYHRGLFPGHFSNSLDFRWKYWVASAGIFRAHPWIGVGWSNFSLHYLAHRLPEAAEEIKDPHSFLVRFFAELGIVGGGLCIAWLLRLTWEITLPGDDRITLPREEIPLTLGKIVPILVLGMLLSMLASIDFNLPVMDILALAMRPVLFLLVLLVGGIAAAMRSANTLDDRPAPWIYYCTVTGIGLFLLHNLIDFSWFEPEAMFVFMALIGSVQGMAAHPGDMGLRPMPEVGESKAIVENDAAGTGRRPVSRLGDRRTLALAAAVACAITWVAVATFFVVPVVAAEQLANNANESILAAPASGSGARSISAATGYLQAAASTVPYNSDYVYRQATACLRLGQYTAAQSLIDRAKKINPLQPDAYLLDANMQLRPDNKHPDPAVVMADFQTVLRLNPNDVSLHLQYAMALERFGLKTQAKKQYELALAADAALPPGEPKRLPPQQVRQLRARANGL